MKIDVVCKWGDEDMAKFPQLKSQDFTILIDLDYCDDVFEFYQVFVDEVYRVYDIVITDRKAVDAMVQNWDEIYDAI